MKVSSLHVFANTCYLLSDNTGSAECEVIFHCGFGLSFSCWLVMKFFSCAYWTAICFLHKNDYSCSKAIF